MDALPFSDPPAIGPVPATSTRVRVWRVLRYVIGLVIVGLAVYAVSGKTDELSGATAYLDDLSWGWAAFAAGAEAASYLAFARMQQRLLAAGGVRVPLRRMTNVTLAGNVLQSTLPGGVVVSSAWSFRQFRRFGADEVLSGWMLVSMAAVSFVSLAVLAGAGLAMAASAGSALGLVGVIIGLVGIALAVVFGWSRRTWVIGHAVRLLRLSKRLVHRPAGDPQALIDEAMVKVSAISPTWADWGWALLWGSANWILDMSCLALAFEAVGVDVPWRGLLLAYAAAQLATNLPITPGGLGVVEGSLTVALVAFGGARASTVAAVLIYRLLSFWIVLPIGWGVLGALTVSHRRQRALVPVAVASEERS